MTWVDRKPETWGIGKLRFERIASTAGVRTRGKNAHPSLTVGMRISFFGVAPNPFDCNFSMKSIDKFLISEYNMITISET